MLSFMAMDYFRQSPMLFFPLLALAIFMLVFFAVTVRALRTRQSCYERIARLPLDGAGEEGRGQSHE